MSSKVLPGFSLFEVIFEKVFARVMYIKVFVHHTPTRAAVPAYTFTSN
jgi:hypothetical protein